MRFLWLAATLLSATPALALQTPDGSKNRDPRVCDVNYDPNDVTAVPSIEGQTIAIRFGAQERIANVAPSDTAHLRYWLTEGSNLLWLKATSVMPTQPISIRTLREDGMPRDYSLEWSAAADDADHPPVRVASVGEVKVEEIKPAKPPTVCYEIRFLYPTEVSAAAAAAWRARKAKDAADAAEIALHKDATSSVGKNVRYVGQGYASIGPVSEVSGEAAIFDDGYTTTLHFPGNMRIPIIETRAPDGKPQVVTNITTEQHGVLKIHQVLPFLQLRDDDLTLCITNLGFSAVGNNPGTGTTSADITREVHAR